VQSIRQADARFAAILGLDGLAQAGLMPVDQAIYYKTSRRNIWCESCGEHIHYHYIEGTTAIICMHCKYRHCIIFAENNQIPPEDWNNIQQHNHFPPMTGNEKAQVVTWQSLYTYGGYKQETWQTSKSEARKKR